MTTPQDISTPASSTTQQDQQQQQQIFQFNIDQTNNNNNNNNNMYPHDDTNNNTTDGTEQKTNAFDVSPQQPQQQEEGDTYKSLQQAQLKQSLTVGDTTNAREEKAPGIIQFQIS